MFTRASMRGIWYVCDSGNGTFVRGKWYVHGRGIVRSQERNMVCTKRKDQTEIIWNIHETVSGVDNMGTRTTPH